MKKKSDHPPSVPKAHAPKHHVEPLPPHVKQWFATGANGQTAQFGAVTIEEARATARRLLHTSAFEVKEVEP